MPNPDQPPMSAAQAAAESQIPLRTIQLALTRGEIKAHKFPGLTGAWVIDRDDFTAWAADRKVLCEHCRRDRIRYRHGTRRHRPNDAGVA